MMSIWSWRTLPCLLLALLASSCISVPEVQSLGDATGVSSVGSQDAPSHFICWNVHKATDERFKEEVEALLEEIPKGDGVIMCMQEVRSSTWELIKGLHREKVSGHYASSWRLPFSGRSTGVLTVANQPLPDAGARVLRSPKREFLVASPKVSLVTEMPLAGGRKLEVVNCHGLNFVTSSVFADQLDEIFKVLENCDSPAIVCGDFNVWSDERLGMLEQRAKRVGMSEVGVRGHSDSPAPQWLKGLKKVNGFDPDIRLDRIFTRGLEVMDCYCGEHTVSSDHLPLVLRFRIAKP